MWSSCHENRSKVGHQTEKKQKGLNEMYVWFLLAYLPYVFNPTPNTKMVFGEIIPKMDTFSDFVTIFFVKCYNKIWYFPYLHTLNFVGMQQEPHIYFI